jgi:hypothetical protein
LGAQIFFYKTKSSQEIVVKLGKCPVYSGAEMLGMGAKTIETMPHWFPQAYGYGDQAT